MKPMEFSRRQWLGGAAALGVGAGMGMPAMAQDPGKWPNVTSLISSYVDGRKVANMVAVFGFGQAAPMVLAAGADTFGQPRKSDGNSLYRIYSMTKPITGMTTMQLIDEGKLGLDQPLHEILPKFRNMQVQKTYDGGIGPDDLEPARRPITIRQMLTHTAGLGYPIVQSGPIAEAMRTRGVVPGLATRLQNSPAFRGTPVRGLDNFADRLAEFPLVYQPGEHWSYSMAADLLGRVIEVVENKPFDRVLQERFFDPLGMADTGFRVPASKADRLTTSYLLVGGVPLPIDLGRDSIYLEEPPFPFGGAGLASSPLDYDKFLRMLLALGEPDGKRVMGELAVRVGTSDLLPDTLLNQETYGKEWGFGALGRVGRGMWEGVYGWAGAAGTIGFIHSKLGLRAGLFTQYMPSNAYPLNTEFPAAVLADLKAQGLA